LAGPTVAWIEGKTANRPDITFLPKTVPSHILVSAPDIPSEVYTLTPTAGQPQTDEGVSRVTLPSTIAHVDLLPIDNRPLDICLYVFCVAELYHTERNHQGVGKRLLKPLAMVSRTDKPIRCRERIGGMLNFYYREAAWKCAFYFLHPTGWKRDYGTPYTGTKEETSDPDKGSPSGLPRQSSTLPESPSYRHPQVHRRPFRVPIDPLTKSGGNAEPTIRP